jgi:CubicO group peptidase (beta-lactamase class C family)
MLCELLPRVGERIERCRSDGLVPHGLQVFVSVNSDVVLDVAVGDARPGLPMSTQTILRQHCTAAPFLSFAVAQLVSQGRVSLDQPVADLIADFAHRGKAGITLRQVLTHTAGLHAADSASPERSHLDPIEAICETPLPPGWIPGRDAAYSHVASWHVLRRVVELVVGENLTEHLRRAVFLPLGMTDTCVGMSVNTHRRVQHQLGVNYWSGNGDSFESWLGQDLVANWHEISEQTCLSRVPWGAFLPARDLGRFYQMLVDRVTVEEIGGVRSDVLDTFVSAQRSEMYDTGLGRVCDYGYGFMVNLRGHHVGDRCSERSYGHSGASGSSVGFADEKHGLAVGLLANDILDPESCFLRRTAIVNAIYEDLTLT